MREACELVDRPAHGAGVCAHGAVVGGGDDVLAVGSEGDVLELIRMATEIEKEPAGRDLPQASGCRSRGQEPPVVGAEGDACDAAEMAFQGVDGNAVRDLPDARVAADRCRREETAVVAELDVRE